MLAGLWSDTAASGCGGWAGSHTQWLPVTGRVRSLVAGILLAATSPPLSNTVAGLAGSECAHWLSVLTTPT